MTHASWLKIKKNMIQEKQVHMASKALPGSHEALRSTVKALLLFHILLQLLNFETQIIGIASKKISKKIKPFQGEDNSKHT